MSFVYHSARLISYGALITVDFQLAWLACWPPANKQRHKIQWDQFSHLQIDSQIVGFISILSIIVAPVAQFISHPLEGLIAHQVSLHPPSVLMDLLCLVVLPLLFLAIFASFDRMTFPPLHTH